MKIVIGCSGGPDSMALLDMCRKKEYEILAAHVNYKQRDTADRDEKIVQTYCQKYNIEYRIQRPTYVSGNFQAWARDVRYRFFKDCADEFGTKKIYTAHQLDDRLETYIFQKKRGMICETFGLERQSDQNGYTIHRPLLQYEKRELQAYCDKNGIRYGIDESNLTDHYTRNRIRHTQIDGMTGAEKKRLSDWIDLENKELLKRRESASTFDGSVSNLSSVTEAWFVLDWFLFRHTHRHYSQKHLHAMLKQIRTDCLIDLNDYWLESWKGYLYCQKKMNRYCRICSFIEYGVFEQYTIARQGKTIEGITVSRDDFPLMIRDVKKGDSIQLRWGTKKISRFFIDRKISKLSRMHWKVIENAQGTVIFVPGIGCDVKHFSTHPSFFMIQ